MGYQALFSPIKIGADTLKHRVVLLPLTRLHATPKHVPSDLQAEYYTERATDGGLMITESTMISPTAGAYPQIPGIFNKEHIEGWEKGAVIFQQIWHIGRVGSKYPNPNHEPVVGLSDTPCPVDEIKAIVGDYAQAAKNDIDAGFDGVDGAEIHGANGYFVDQFINTSSNKRTDIYDGSTESRGHFALKVVDAVAEAVGEERIATRFSPGGVFQGMATENSEETWGYLTTELQKDHPGLAYLHVVECRTNFNGTDQMNTTDILESYRQIWQESFITAGGFSTSLEFDNDIAEKKGNLIAYGRAFVANLNLPERLCNDWELNPFHRDTFYTHDAEGYIDYPFYNEKN